MSFLNKRTKTRRTPCEADIMIHAIDYLTEHDHY